MKNKILSLWFGLSLLLIVNIINCKPECERLHLYDVEKGRNIIPDEETAKEIAYILVEANSGFEDSEFYYEAEVSFNEETKEWEVIFSPRTYDGKFILDGEKIVHLNRDSGIVTFLFCGWD